MSYSEISKVQCQGGEAEARLKTLRKIARNNKVRLFRDEAYRYHWLAAVHYSLMDSKRYKEAYSVLKKGLRIHRPPTRSTYALTILMVNLFVCGRQLRLSSRAIVREMAQVPFFLDVATEPAAALLLREIALPNIAEFPEIRNLACEVAARYNVSETPSNIKKLAKVVYDEYKGKYLGLVWD